MDDSILDTALFYKNICGFDVIPDHPTEKYPYKFNGWQTRDFTADDLKQKIGEEGWGIGLRNQEILDFDNKGNPGASELLEHWKEIVEAQAPGLVDRLTIETTQSGGYHIGYKCSVIEGNQDLATRPPTAEELAANQKKREVTLIETRGTGGQVMVAPSPGYKVIQGGWPHLQEITPEEREILFDSARALDTPRESKPKVEKSLIVEGDRPGDVYNGQHTEEALELLQRAGWATVYSRNEVTYLRRPGKKHGVSATFNYRGCNALYVFSSNASPFEMQQLYSPFAIYATLEHGGDFGSAAKTLATQFGLNGNSNDIQKLQLQELNDPIESDTPQTTFKRLGLVDLFKESDKEWLIDNFLGKKDLAMLFGDPGTGKSFLAVDLIYCAIQGRRFADKFDIGRPLSVAYTASEGIGGLPQRFTAAMNRYQVDPKKVDNLHIFLDSPQLYDSKAATFIDTFVNDWRDSAWGNLDLLILDTLHGSMWGGDENSSKDMGLVLRSIKWARDALNCAILLIHHTNRQGGYRGSSALHGALDSQYQTKVMSESIFSLENPKQKDAERFQPLYFKLTPEHYSQSVYCEWLDKVTIQLDKPTKKEQAKEDIVSLLGIEPDLSQSEIVKRVTAASRVTVLEALKELETEGLVKMIPGRVKNEKLYQLSSCLV